VPIEIQGKTYYRTSEACNKIGISRATLFRWLKAGILEKHYKNHRGWRIFTEEDLTLMHSESVRIKVEYSFPSDNSNKSPAKDGLNATIV
jgi:predicted site-specific integrase-resolvase